MSKLKQSSWLSILSIEWEKSLYRVTCLIHVCVAFKKCTHISSDFLANSHRLSRKSLTKKVQVHSISPVRELIGYTQGEAKAVVGFDFENYLAKNPIITES